MRSVSRRTVLRGVGALTVISPLPLADARPSRFWPSPYQAAVSLTYDDGLDSQLANVIPALEARDFKATFFLTRQNMEARAADWQRVAQRGHEIGDHTFHHVCAPTAYSSDRYEREEIAPTESFLDTYFGANPRRLFAYPCGDIELGHGPQLQRQLAFINMLRRHFVAARAADGDPNDPLLVGRQRFQLQAIAPTYDADDPRLALAYLRKAIGWRRWAIIIFHDVLPARLGEGDTSIANHNLILDWIAHQKLWCAPMGEVFDHLTGNVAV